MVKICGTTPSTTSVTTVRQRRQLHLHREELAWQSADRHLGRTLGTAGDPSAIVGLDSAFKDVVTLNMLRAYIQSRCGLDIGFDAGPETFSSMLALQLLSGSKALWKDALIARLAPRVKESNWNGRFRFFFDHNGFASDTDCTGVAAATLYETGYLTREELLHIGTQLLAAAAHTTVTADKNRDAKSHESNGALVAGVVMVYWEDGLEPGVEKRGKKHDAAACANAVYALKLAQREGLQDRSGVIEATQRYILEHLLSGAYRKGTRYYPSPDAFLYFVSRLHHQFDDCKMIFGRAVQEALAERNAMPAKPSRPDDPMLPLNLAMRVLVAQNLGDVGVPDQKAHLIRQQAEDGSWIACPFYSLGRLPFFFGSATQTTLFAHRALSGAEK